MRWTTETYHRTGYVFNREDTAIQLTYIAKMEGGIPEDELELDAVVAMAAGEVPF